MRQDVPDIKLATKKPATNRGEVAGAKLEIESRAAKLEMEMERRATARAAAAAAQ